MNAVRLIVHGRVQGVGFRYFAQEQAMTLGLSGWVRNLPEGSVEAYGQGEKKPLEAWLNQLRQGPPMSRVESIETEWTDTFSDRISGFTIR